jgi:hypothetical protein
VPIFANERRERLKVTAIEWRLSIKRILWDANIAMRNFNVIEQDQKKFMMWSKPYIQFIHDEIIRLKNISCFVLTLLKGIKKEEDISGVEKKRFYFSQCLLEA